MYLKQPTTQQVTLQHTLQLLARTLRDQATRSHRNHSKLSPLQGAGGKGRVDG